MEKQATGKKTAATPNLTEDYEPQTYKDKYAIFLSKASNGLDCYEIFEFKFEVANFGGEVKEKFAPWNEIDANNAIVDTIETGYKIPFISSPKFAYFQNNHSAITIILILSRMILMICYLLAALQNLKIALTLRTLPQ